MDEEELERLAAQAERDAESMGVTPEEAVLVSPLDFDTGMSALERVDFPEEVAGQESSPFLPATGALEEPEVDTQPDPSTPPAPSTPAAPVEPVEPVEPRGDSDILRWLRHAATGAATGFTFGPDNLERVVGMFSDNPAGAIEEFRSGDGTYAPGEWGTVDLPVVGEISPLHPEFIGGLAGGGLGAHALSSAAGAAARTAPVSVPLALAARALSSVAGRSGLSGAAARTGAAISSNPVTRTLLTRESVGPGIGRNLGAGLLRSPQMGARAAARLTPFLPFIAMGITPRFDPETGEFTDMELPGPLPSVPNPVDVVQNIPSAFEETAPLAFLLGSVAGPFSEWGRAARSRRASAAERARDTAGEMALEPTGQRGGLAEAPLTEGTVTEAARQLGRGTLELFEEGDPRARGISPEQIERSFTDRAVNSMAEVRELPITSEPLTRSPEYNTAAVELVGTDRSGTSNLRSIMQNTARQDAPGLARPELVDRMVADIVSEPIAEAYSDMGVRPGTLPENMPAIGERVTSIVDRLNERADRVDADIDLAYRNIPAEGTVDLLNPVLRENGVGTPADLRRIAGSTYDPPTISETVARSTNPIRSPLEGLGRVISVIRFPQSSAARQRSAFAESLGLSEYARDPGMRLSPEQAAPPQGQWQPQQMPQVAARLRQIRSEIMGLDPDQSQVAARRMALRLIDDVNTALDSQTGLDTRGLRTRALVLRAAARNLQDSANAGEGGVLRRRLEDFERSQFRAMLDDPSAYDRAVGHLDEAMGVRRTAARPMVDRTATSILGPGQIQAAMERGARELADQTPGQMNPLEGSARSINRSRERASVPENRQVLRGISGFDSQQLGPRLSNLFELGSEMVARPGSTALSVITGNPNLPQFRNARSSTLLSMADLLRRRTLGDVYGSHEESVNSLEELWRRGDEEFTRGMNERNALRLQQMRNMGYYLPEPVGDAPRVDAADNYRNNMTTGGANQE